MSNNDKDLIFAAQQGDRTAYSKLIESASTPLRKVIKRLIGHPEDTEEIIQDTMLKAWTNINSFREDSTFATWLCSIGARTAIDYLRKQKTWRPHAQIAYSNECATTPELASEVVASVSTPDYVFDMHEHIAYCFGCVSRSLSPNLQAALVLREVLGLSAKEASNILDTSESAYKHHLSNARKEMTEVFEGLCTLVNKGGVCYQCKGLSEFSHNKRNNINTIRSLDERIRIVASVDPADTVTHAMHDLFWRRTAEFEEIGRGSCDANSDCGK